MLKVADIRSRTGTGTFAVLDVSRSIGPGDAGAVLSIHKGQAAAIKAAKGLKHSRVVQLRNSLKVGDHPNPMSDLVQERNSRWM